MDEQILKDVVLAPEGELFIFQNEDEVKQFFSLIHFAAIEPMSACGLLVKGLNDYNYDLPEDEDDDIECPTDYGTLRIHTPVDEYCYFQSGYVLSPDLIELDVKKWTGFPAVAFIWLDTLYDRVGSTSIRLCAVSELSKIGDIKQIGKFMSPDLVKVRKDKHDELCRLQDERDLHTDRNRRVPI